MNIQKLKLLTLFVFYFSMNCFAQGSGPPPPGDPDPVAASIDKEIPILMAIGFVVGIFFIVTKRKL